MRVLSISLAIIFITAASVAAQTSDGGKHLDNPPPRAALDLVKHSIELAGQDRIEEAVATARKAITIAPDYLEAHQQYLRLRVQFQGKVDEAVAEYQSLMVKEPSNPVYPAAMWLSVRAPSGSALFKRVAELAPEWSWGHYANSFVILGRDYYLMNDKFEGRGEQMLSELRKAIERNESVASFYTQAIFLQENMSRVDDAISTAEKMSAQKELHADGLAELWRLRLAKAKGSEAAKEELKSELARLSAGSQDIILLAAIRNAYTTLLKDPVAADAIERKMRKSDPGWYPERGDATFEVQFNSTGIPFPVLAANHQLAISAKLKQIILKRESDNREQMREIEALLTLHPNPGLKNLIYGILFSVARRAEDVQSMIRYSRELLLLDSTNTASLARIALAMAGRRMSLPTALRYAQRAETATRAFRPMNRPPDIPARDFDYRFSLAKQQDNFKHQQALALDAVGSVLFQMGNNKAAEINLRRSVDLNKTELSLTHFAEALKRLGRVDEAQKMTQELDASLLESIKQQFTNRPSKDFQLEAIDGRRYRLSDLKGKVVLVSFWATWCGPCVSEMPLLAKTYAKYKDCGFEIMAVSADAPNERDKVREFARAHTLPFPVLFDDGIAKLYDVDGYPGNFFIDRDGRIRYSQGSFDEGNRRFEIVLEELLK